MTEDLQLLAYCGVDCAACPDHRSKACPGCRDSVWKEGDECMPIACCRGQRIAFCGECPGFPCADIKAFYEESDGHRAAYRRMCAMRPQQ